jgi:Uma2 family endonuclease
LLLSAWSESLPRVYHKSFSQVVSPSDTIYEVEEKVEDWLTAGTVLVWVVNSRKRTVTVYTANQPARLLTESDTLTGQELIPGFEYSVKEIF